MEKNRKTINVSLQSKKYSGPINDLINRWEEDGNNLSVQICENLLKLDQLEHSGTMLKVLNLYELTKRTANIYNIKDETKIEEILSKAIIINPSAITEIFIGNSNTTSRETVEQINYMPPVTQPVERQELTQVDRQNESSLLDNPINDVPFSLDDGDIPMDFLLNS